MYRMLEPESAWTAVGGRELRREGEAESERNEVLTTRVAEAVPRLATAARKKSAERILVCKEREAGLLGYSLFVDQRRKGDLVIRKKSP
jgi:hypothetical protein